METSSRRLLVVLVALATLVVGVATEGSAGAAPRKIGPVTGLTLTVTKPSATYAVRVTWNSLAAATKYVVRLTTPSGGTLDSATVTGAAWTAHTTASAGTTVVVKVTPYAGRRRGVGTSSSTVLPDVTAPVATYSVLRDPVIPSNGSVTVVVDALSDDVSTNNHLTQTINWGEVAGSDVTWPTSQAEISHVYPDALATYYATVTLTDEAGNSSTYTLTIAVNDETAPTGSFALNQASAWAKWTRVSLRQIAINDNLSADNKIARVIHWGDNTSSNWPAGTNVSHRYAAAGSYSPSVTLTDEAGNTNDLPPAGTVTVKVDSARPRLRLVLPTTRTAYVDSWRTLHGRARDAGTGMRFVRVRAIEKRGASWFGYRPASHSWAKGGATKASGWTKSRVGRVKTTATHTWAFRLVKLTKGTLVYRASAVDNVLNASAWKSHRALLTKS